MALLQLRYHFEGHEERTDKNLAPSIVLSIVGTPAFVLFLKMEFLMKVASEDNYLIELVLLQMTLLFFYSYSSKGQIKTEFIYRNRMKSL
jgi:hypothetical protein